MAEQEERGMVRRQEGAPARIGATPELTVGDVKKWINPNVSDEEAYFFLQFCKAQQLNPFTKEAYLIKYSKDGEPATIVTSYHVFLKRAEQNPNYAGFKAGIIVLDAENRIVHREGAFYQAGEKLLGGWAEAYRTDRQTAARAEVAFEEYVGRKRDGSITAQWRTKPGTMIRKVPVAQAHRDAFPNETGRLYVFEEFGGDEGNLPKYEIGKHPEIPATEESAAGARYAEPERKDEGGAAGPPAPPGEDSPRASEPQIKAINAIFGKLGIKDDDQKKRKAEAILGLAEGSLESFKDLGGGKDGQASFLISTLDAILKEG